MVSVVREQGMARVNVASFFVLSFGGEWGLSPSLCSEKKSVFRFSANGNITNRPSPTRESIAALRGFSRGRAARLKRYV